MLNDAMGEKAKRLPPRPRAVLNGMTILPLVDDEWQPVKDQWVLPGRAAITTQELRDLARARGWALKFIGNKQGGSK
jgi:hypothetical protein